MIDCDADSLHDSLLGVQLTCIFAIVGLASFAMGWVEASKVDLEESVSAVGTAPTPAAEPIPGWVEPVGWVVVGILVLSVTIDAVHLFRTSDDAWERVLRWKESVSGEEF